MCKIKTNKQTNKRCVWPKENKHNFVEKRKSVCEKASVTKIIKYVRDNEKTSVKRKET